MKIWLINHYALTPDMAGGTRHYDIARQLVARGHRVTVIAAGFHYATLQEMKHYPDGSDMLHETIDGIDFLWIKTRPYRGNSLGRVLNMFDFTRKLRRLRRADAPDLIVGSSVHLFAVYAAYRLARFFGTPWVMEVRDLWPRTLIDMGMARYHPFVLLLRLLEPFLYRRADHIITLLPRAGEHITTFGIDAAKITWISNGVDLARFATPNTTMRLDAGSFNLLYLGTLGTANNLEALIDAAAQLDDLPDLRITLIGSGPQKGALQARAAARPNVTFAEPVPKSEVAGVLDEADLLYVGLRNLPLYRFGMSMNKVFDYMAAAKPIIFASDVPDNPVANAHCGIITPPEDPTSIAEAIRALYRERTPERRALGDRGREYVRTHFAMPVIADTFESVLTKVTNEHEKHRAG